MTNKVSLSFPLIVSGSTQLPEDRLLDLSMLKAFDDYGRECTYGSDKDTPIIRFDISFSNLYRCDSKGDFLYRDFVSDELEGTMREWAYDVLCKRTPINSRRNKITNDFCDWSLMSTNVPSGLLDGLYLQAAIDTCTGSITWRIQYFAGQYFPREMMHIRGWMQGDRGYVRR